MPTLLEAQQELVEEVQQELAENSPLSTDPPLLNGPYAELLYFIRNNPAVTSALSISVAGLLTVGLPAFGIPLAALFLGGGKYLAQRAKASREMDARLADVTNRREPKISDTAKEANPKSLEGRLSEEQTKILENEIEMLKLSITVFGHSKYASAWLGEPNLMTDNQPPVVLLSSSEGCKTVENLLLRIQYGVLA
jgi:hypothetical protein